MVVAAVEPPPAAPKKRKVAPEDIIDVMDGRKVVECNRCPRLCDSRTQIVNHYGPMNPRIAVVLTAPGEAEDNAGRPAVGSSGETLRLWIEMCGLNPDRDVAYAEAIMCHPEAGKEPTPTEIKSCNAHLWQWLEETQPDIIIAAGNPACAALLPEEIATEGITKLRGHVFWNERLQRKIVPMFHPNAMLNDFDKEPLCLADLRKAIAESKAPTREPVGLGEYFVLESVEDIEDLVEDMLETSEVLSFDTETANRRGGTALNWRSSEILCLGFTDAVETGYVVPFWGQNWRQIWTDAERARIIAALKRLFESDIPKVAQNGKFDEHQMEHDLGIEVKNLVIDTMYSCALIFENMSRSLESQRSLFTTMPFYDILVGEQTDGKKHMEWAEEHVLHTYQAADVDCTLRCAMAIMPLLEKEEGNVEGYDALWVLDNISMPLAQVFKHMEERGAMIDMALAEHVIEECDKQIALAEREVFKHIPADVVVKENLLNSHDQIKKLLWVDMKVSKPGRLTDGGKKCKHCLNCTPNEQHYKHTASDADALAEVRDLHPIIPCLEEYNQLHTLRKTFLLGDEGKNTGLLQHIQDDGRIHTSFRVDGTETGRASSSPNLQNIPKDESGKKDAAPRPDIYKFVRKLFCAPEGHVLMNADYSQLELRVLSYVSGEKEMIRQLEGNEDFHFWVSRNILFPELDPELTNEAWKKKWKPKRDAAKTFSFGLSYGMTVYGLMTRLGVDEKEATRLLNLFLGRLTKLREYFHKKDRQLNKRHRAVNVLGRPRHFYGVESMRHFGGYRRQLQGMRRENYNFDIQSAGSDFLSLSCIAIDNDPQCIEWGVKLFLTVHDSIMFEVPQENAEAAGFRIAELMAEAPERLLGWYLPAEVQWGPRWTEWTHEIDPEGKLEMKEAA